MTVLVKDGSALEAEIRGVANKDYRAFKMYFGNDKQRQSLLENKPEVFKALEDWYHANWQRNFLLVWKFDNPQIFGGYQVFLYSFGDFAAYVRDNKTGLFDSVRRWYNHKDSIKTGKYTEFREILL